MFGVVANPTCRDKIAISMWSVGHKRDDMVDCYPVLPWPVFDELDEAVGTPEVLIQEDVF